jgi:hypothetical protein
MNHNNKEWLQYQYQVMKLNPREISQLCGVSDITVRARLKKFNIKTRTISEGLSIKSNELSARSKEYFSNPINRQKLSDNLKQVQNARKAQLSESAKLSWTRNRAAFLASQKVMRTKAYLTNLSEGVKKSWTPERRAKQSDITNSLWKTAEFQMKQTLGNNRMSSAPGFQERCAINTKKNWQSKEYRKTQASSRVNIKPTSILESIIITILYSRGIEAKQVAYDEWTFDIGFTHEGRNVLIECNGDYWHSLPECANRDMLKKRYFDKELSNTHEIYYIKEHEFYGIKKIMMIIDSIIRKPIITKQFEFNELAVSIIGRDECNDFLSCYHYLDKGRSGLAIGVKLDGILIACARFTGLNREQTSDRYNLSQNQMLELSRFCIHPDYHKHNLASWFLAKCVRFVPHQIKMLVAFSDIGAGHSGTIYKAAGWTPDGKTKPSYWYIDESGLRYHKKSVWDQAKRLSQSEDEYARARGLVKINGLAVLRFVKQHKSVTTRIGM